MDFNRQSNRPAQRVTTPVRPAAQPAAPALEVNSAQPSQTRQPENRNKHGIKHVLLTSVVALTLLGGGYALGSSLSTPGSSEIGRVDKSKNQAVFMSNDQVYFGKITEITDTVIVMENIYYLQGNAAQNSPTGQGTATSQQSNVALTKLGDELHGPEDRMQINREQVLFWENLKSDGKVSEAIKAYKP